MNIGENRIEERLVGIANVFTERLREQVVDDVVGDARAGECTLALETLCDQLFEYDVTITQQEYREISELGRLLNADSDRIEYLKQLIR